MQEVKNNIHKIDSKQTARKNRWTTGQGSYWESSLFHSWSMVHQQELNAMKLSLLIALQWKVAHWLSGYEGIQMIPSPTYPKALKTQGSQGNEWLGDAGSHIDPTQRPGLFDQVPVIRCEFTTPWGTIPVPKSCWVVELAIMTAQRYCRKWIKKWIKMVQWSWWYSTCEETNIQWISYNYFHHHIRAFGQ